MMILYLWCAGFKNVFIYFFVSRRVNIEISQCLLKKTNWVIWSMNSLSYFILFFGLLQTIPQFIFSESPLSTYPNQGRCEKLIWTVVFFLSWLLLGANGFQQFVQQYESQQNTTFGILHPIEPSHLEHPAFINTADNHFFRFAVNKSWPDVSTVLLSVNSLTLLVVKNPDRHMLTDLTVWQLIKHILRH